MRKNITYVGFAIILLTGCNQPSKLAADHANIRASTNMEKSIVNPAKTLIDDIATYKNALNDLADLEKEIVDTYDSVTGKNYKNDKLIYDMLVHVIIPKNEDFIRQIEKIKPKTQEMKEINNIYIAANRLQKEAFIELKNAVEQNDADMVTNANNKLVESKSMLRTWTEKIEKLNNLSSVTDKAV